MPTYIVGDIHITDTAAYQARAACPGDDCPFWRAGRGWRRQGGCAGRRSDARTDFHHRISTADVARRWYRSEDYQEALKARLSASHGRVLLIEGNEVSTEVPVAGTGDRLLQRDQLPFRRRSGR